MGKNDTCMDLETAWAELARFAAPAGVKLDERAAPGYGGDPVEDDSPVTDYSELLDALQFGRVKIDNAGALAYTWHRAPFDGRNVFALNPEKWAYGKAMVIANGTAVSGDNQAHGGASDNNLTRMFGYLEALGRESPGTMQALTHRSDVELVMRIGKFLMEG